MITESFCSVLLGIRWRVSSELWTESVAATTVSGDLDGVAELLDGLLAQRTIFTLERSSCCCLVTYVNIIVQ